MGISSVCNGRNWRGCVASVALALTSFFSNVPSLASVNDNKDINSEINMELMTMTRLQMSSTVVFSWCLLCPIHLPCLNPA